MHLKRGLWLSMVDEAGEETPVAGTVDEEQPGRWVLEAIIPPQVYPVRYVAAQLRLDGQHLSLLRLPEPIVTVTHQPTEVRLTFPIDEQRLAAIRGRRPAAGVGA